MGMAPWKHTPPHMCYHTRFCCSLSNNLGVRRGLKNLGCWGPAPCNGDVTDPTRNILLPHLCYHAKFGHYISNHTSIIMAIWRQNLSLSLVFWVCLLCCYCTPSCIVIFCVICVFCLLVVLVRLSEPVVVIDWKDTSLKWPVMCWWGR